MKEINGEWKPEPCKHCQDPIYDDQREFEVNGKPACLKCYVESGKRVWRLGENPDLGTG
jgi:formylmethanofuran dehydrogenase subunit E